MTCFKGFRVCVLFIFQFLFLSCEKPNLKIPPPQEENQEGFLDTLWTAPIDPANPNQLCYSLQMFEYKDLFYHGGVDCDQRLRAVDKEGNQKWVSSHAIFTEDMYSRRKAIQDGEWFYFIYNQVIYKLNLNTDALTTLYTVPQHLFVWKLVKHNNKLFMSTEKFQFDNDWVALLTVDVNTASLDTVWNHSRTDNMIPSMVTPHITSENGQEVAYFAIGHFQDGDPTNQFADIYCYDLTKDKLAWKVASFENEASISTTPPVVNGGVVVKIGYRTIYGFDKQTGALLWTYDSPDDDGHFAAGFLANDGPNVVAKADNDHFVSIHASSGFINYDLENTGYTPSWKYYIMDGVIYFVTTGDAHFVAIRLSDGKKLMFAQNPPEHAVNEFADITDWFVIDKESRIGVVHDFSRLTAFKIPDFQ